MTRQALALALVGLFSGCGGGEADSSPPVGQSPSVGQPPSNEERGQMEIWMLDLMLADRASNNLVQGNGPSSWSTAFAPGGSWIRAGAGEIQGRDAIHETFMEDVYSNALADLVWTPMRAEVSRGGDLGYTVGQYRVVGVDTAGVRRSVVGMYVRIWARQPDDSWKVEMEIRNPVTEPEVMPEPTPGRVP